MSSFLCALPLIAGLFTGCGPEMLATGYVEGEFALVAPSGSARVSSLAVRRGDLLARGAVIATQESRDAELALGEARAAEEQAMATLQNLEQGKRPEEIAVIEATLVSGRAEFAKARLQYERLTNLRDRGFAAQSEADNATTALNVASARVGELQAELDVARLPAREAEILAARHAVEKATAAREMAQWRLDERTVRAPADGMVFDLVLRPGETAGPSAPVVSFLPDGAIKLKLYVPQDVRSLLAPGTRLDVLCDGCPDGQTATVSWISDEPEYTPPVIYSVGTRQKLVYLVEARPDDASSLLRPGQIVDVRLPGDGR
jgi:HlyD family secretion protein